MERMRPSPVYMTRFATLKSESKHRLGAQKSTSTSPWYTRCPGRLNVCMPIRHQVESGAAFSADTGSPNRHCGREGRPPGGYTASECRSRAFFARHRVCRLTGGGTHAMRAGSADRPRRVGCFRRRGAQAKPLRSAGTSVLRRAQLQTLRPRGGTL